MTLIGMRAHVRMDTRRIQQKVKQANITSMGHAAAAIRLVARRSIRRGKKKSPEGKPPRTRKGQLKRSILYKVEQDEAVIGPAHAVVGTAGAAHEHGGQYRGDRYPRRPFMGPALEKIKPRLPRFWRGSVR